MGIPPGTHFKSFKIEEFPVPEKQMHKESRSTAAGEAGHDPHRQSSGPKRRAVYDQLGIEQNRGHHKRCQVILPHPLLPERSRDGNRPVHAQRRCDSQQTCRYDSQQPPLRLPHPCKQRMDPVFREHRDGGSKHHAQDPVQEDLPQLKFKIIPDIYPFTPQNGE